MAVMATAPNYSGAYGSPLRRQTCGLNGARAQGSCQGRGEEGCVPR